MIYELPGNAIENGLPNETIQINLAQVVRISVHANLNGYEYLQVLYSGGASEIYKLSAINAGMLRDAWREAVSPSGAWA